MRAVVQRVTSASVTAGGKVVGEIGGGLLALVGVEEGDEEKDARRLAAKIARLRIFADSAGKMNLAVTEASGSVIVVSQFTLLGDARRGNRPSFAAAAPPEKAEALVNVVAAELRAIGVAVAEGRFGAHMQVALVNDGPVTIII